MTRNLKALGLALVAVFAISAMAASAAQAAPGLAAFNTISEENETAELSGEQTSGSLRDKLTIGGIALRCSTSTSTAHLPAGGASEITVEPTYEGCLTAGLFATHVALNGCHYRLYGLEEAEADSHDATTDILCPEGNEITITTTNLAQTETLCTIHIPEQTGLEYAEVIDQTAAEPADIELVGHYSGITAEVTNGVAECPITAGHYENASFVGTTTVTAENEKGTSIDLSAGPLGPVGPEPAELTAFNTFTEEHETAILLAEQTPGSSRDKFNIAGVAFSCSESTATAHLETGTAAEITVAPTYSGCSLGGLYAMHVELNGCDYRIYNLNRIEAHLYKATTSILCPEANEITINVTNIPQTETICTIHIPEQTGLEYAEVIDQTAAEPADIELVGHYSGITAEVTGGEECLITPGHYENATLEGTTTVRAESASGEPLDLSAVAQ